MVEAVGGKMDLKMLEITSGMVPLRTWTMLSAVRYATKEIKETKKDERLMKVYKEGRDVERFHMNQEDGLRHAIKAVMELCKLIQFCVLDIHDVKQEIKKIWTEDQILGKLNFPMRIEKKLEEDTVNTLRQINAYLRKESDIVGALIRE